MGKVLDMIRVMKELLKDKEVSVSLISQFREDCKGLIENSRKEIIQEVETKIEGRMNAVNEKNTEQDDWLTSPEKRADNSEQETRSVNLIIRGLTNTNNQTEEELVTNIASSLSRKLEVKHLPTDIRYAIQLGKDVKEHNRQVKVVFHEWRAKEFIFRKRGL